jgi:GH25 family lysozyme M1 (1,4-beta-N-acetylmuramidase)
MDQVEAEVKKLTGTAGRDPGSLPPCVDVEFTAPQASWIPTAAEATNIIAGISMWCSAVFSRWGQVPFIYTGVDAWARLRNPTGFGAYPLWDAWYPVGAASIPPLSTVVRGPAGMVPVGFADWRVWQFGSGSVAGVTGAVDCDVFRLSRADLYAMAGRTPPP